MKRPTQTSNALAGAIFIFAVFTSAAAQDTARGKMLFNGQCRVCHEVQEKERSSAGYAGPNLYGMFDRKAGSAPEFIYSEALLKGDITWDDKTLTAFILDPKGTMGSKMPGTTLKADQVADMIAFMRQLLSKAN